MLDELAKQGPTIGVLVILGGAIIRHLLKELKACRVALDDERKESKTNLVMQTKALAQSERLICDHMREHTAAINSLIRAGAR